MKSTYARKTDNPNMEWSEERRRNKSLQMKQSHKQRKENGRQPPFPNKNKVKIENDIFDLSQAFPTEKIVDDVKNQDTWNEYPLDNSLDNYQVIIDKDILENLSEIVETVNANFGTECTLNSFINNTLLDKVEKLSRFNN